ncbi:hypothetical protein INT48_002702 [Thamnidium elegans]|uniref:Zinc finger PHD-type domain-containing protein n=1 Tax=Thamnidium elegans TaxID=101142 RepID=A0A8H7W371_9FUNG|nr:hypothetical protein INT48_002702 [Thamnidium elegans]
MYIYLFFLKKKKWQLDEPEKFREHLDSEEDAAQWRVDPIGFDKKGSTFWLFDDNRLYKETPKPPATKKSKSNKKKRAAPTARRSSRRNNVQAEQELEEESEEEGEWIPWKLVCASKYEWEQFPSKYANSKNLDEQRFYNLLVNDLIPKIIPVLEEHEREIKKQEALLHRKRSSRILFKELEALERSSSFEPESRSRSSHRIEQKSLEKEQQEMENAAKAREARLLERERRIMEREYRALAREKGQSQEPETIINEAEPNTTLNLKMVVTEKPKKKYKKKEKFDADGNPLPKKEKLDEHGNPIPKKKRGRKPKQKNPDDENWEFDCICGVSGKNLDDGTPMIACEKCSVWQHIICLQKSGQIGKSNSLDDINFVCHKCEDLVDIDIVDEEEEKLRQKRQKIDPLMNNGKIDLPLIQSSWQQSSAVRAEPPINNSKDHITPVNTTPILPNFINNTTNNNYISMQSAMREIVPPVSIESTPIVTPYANVGQPNCTADVLPSIVVQSNSIQSSQNPIVASQNMPAVQAQNLIQQVAQPTPIVTAPSVPTIEATVALEETKPPVDNHSVTETKQDLQGATSSSV